MLAALLACWALAAIVVPLASSLPTAVRDAPVVRRLHDELELLGSGWSGAIDVPTDHVKGPYAWEWSKGGHSTIRIPPGWDAVELEMSPARCAGGKAQRVVFGGDTARSHPVLVLAAGFHWYDVGLGFLHGADTLSLTYGCIVQAIGVHRGEHVAVALAGLQVGRPPQVPLRRSRHPHHLQRRLS